MDVFNVIYERNVWGNNNNENYKGSSGPGSDISYNIDTYIPFLRNFMEKHEITSVVDFGCGDFKCGPSLYDETNIKYTGYDIYQKIIDYHKATQKNENWSFECLDFYDVILTNPDKVVNADMCILKDVLQHWPNEHIETFLNMIIEKNKFKYIIICNCWKNTKSSDIEHVGDWHSLSYAFHPLNKYHAQLLYMYHTKEVCMITAKIE